MEQVKAFVSGGVGGMSLVVVGHPLDTIKVKLQTSDKYTGMGDCFRKTVAAEGVAGLYRGMATPLAGIAPIFAIYFWGFEVGKQLARAVEGKQPDQQLSTLGTMFAGGFSALPGTAVMVPGDRIKVILQAQDPNAPGAFKGPVDAIKGIWKQGGIRALYKGTALTLLRDGPGSVAYYGAYDLMMQRLNKDQAPGAPLSPLKIIGAGGMAGVFNWIVAVPADVMKSRYQFAPEGRYPGGIKQVFTEILKEEGAGSFFKGLTPAVARAFPANAACFLGVEVSKKDQNKDEKTGFTHWRRIAQFHGKKNKFSMYGSLGKEDQDEAFENSQYEKQQLTGLKKRRRTHSDTELATMEHRGQHDHGGTKLFFAKNSWFHASKHSETRHIEKKHGKGSWQHKVVECVHWNSVQAFLAFLLILDIVGLIAELIIETHAPPCAVILNWCQVDPPTNGVNAACREKGDAIELTLEFLFYMSITILSIFELELIILICANGFSFFKNPFYVLDFIVVNVSLSMDLFVHGQVSQDTGAVLILIRLWRFIRLGHSIVEDVRLNKESHHGKDGNEQGQEQEQDQPNHNVTKIEPYVSS